MTAVEWLRNELWEQFKFSFSDNIFEQAKQIESSQTEISDEEIENVAWEKYTGDSARLAWVEAIKWYREQLKSR